MAALLIWPMKGKFGIDSVYTYRLSRENATMPVIPRIVTLRHRGLINECRCRFIQNKDRIHIENERILNKVPSFLQQTFLPMKTEPKTIFHPHPVS